MSDKVDIGHKQTVLVVDDTPENLKIMNEILKEQYTVKLVNGGEAAIRLVAKPPLPDLVLLDVMMPEVDGYEVLRRLQGDDFTRNIPVIFLTALSDTENEEKGLALGAVDYIVKPINPAIALARIKTHLALAERTQTLQGLSQKLSRYVAPQVYKAIFEGAEQARIAAKRKKLTIFFSDIKEFTATTEDLQPEDLTYLLNKYFSEMSKIAIDYGATIDKFVGDAMLVFFGDPDTRGVQEDALQCVRMAIAMQRRMRELQMVWREKGYEAPFEMRIGINTGFCNVGNFGSDMRMDYTVIGSVVNLAARLETAADPNGILLSYETYAHVRDEIAVEEREPVKVKGFKDEIRSFAVSGIFDTNEYDDRYLRRNRPGLRLSVDLKRLGDAERESAVKDLEEIILRLRK